MCDEKKVRKCERERGKERDGLLCFFVPFAKGTFLSIFSNQN